MKLSFNINKVTTGPDEKLFVVGNLSGLGSWKIIDALEMQKIDELAWQSIDYITFKADDTQYLEYKYVKQSNLMDAIWENGDNRKFDLSVYREKQSDPLCVVNIEDKEFDNQAFKAFCKSPRGTVRREAKGMGGAKRGSPTFSERRPL